MKLSLNCILFYGTQGAASRVQAEVFKNDLTGRSGPVYGTVEMTILAILADVSRAATKAERKFGLS